MNEQQSDDLYIPTFYFSLPAKQGNNGRGTEEVEDFLKSVRGWSECAPPDDDDAWI